MVQSKEGNRLWEITWDNHQCQWRNYLSLLLVWHAPLGVVVPNVDISLQSGLFWATSIASFGERLLDFRSWWIVLIHVVWGRPSGLVQFSKVAVKIFLSSVSSGIHAVWPNKEKRRAWTIAESCLWPRHLYHLIPNSFLRPYNLYCVGGDVKPCSINQLSFC